MKTLFIVLFVIVISLCNTTEIDYPNKNKDTLNLNDVCAWTETETNNITTLTIYTKSGDAYVLQK